MTQSAWGPLLVALACAGGVAWAETRPESPDPVAADAQPSPAAIALLGGLGPGDTVAGWTVESIAMPDPRRIRLDFAAKDVGFSITIAPLGELPESPPLQTERYAIYYGHARPQGAELPRGAVRAVLHNLKRTIARQEETVDF